MSLQFQLGARDEVIVVQLSGRIDREAGSMLDQAYAAAATSGTGTIELDFIDVEYINSTGIALIVGLLAKARANKRALRAAGLTDHYRHIFEITRLSDFIEIVEPLELDPSVR